jgi:CCR4-NOT transcriptional regulation complex NOT5 subunit
MQLKISRKALFDHEDRLYESDENNDNIQIHVDGVARYEIIKKTKTIVTVEMNSAAIKEFLDDADYYKECMEGDELPLGRMFARAAESVKKQIAKDGK